MEETKEELIELEYPYIKGKFRTFQKGSIKFVRNADFEIVEVSVILSYDGGFRWGYVRNTYKLNERVTVYDNSLKDIGGVILSFKDHNGTLAASLRMDDESVKSQFVLDFSKFRR
jgi:hypothetical protein